MVENLSNSDFGNLVLKTAYQEGTEILGAMAVLEGSIGELSLTEEFVKVVESRDPAASAKAANNREYMVPAFNRGRKINIYLILKRRDDKVPVASVARD